MNRALFVVAPLALLLSAPIGAFAADYRIGPGQPHRRLGEVAFHDLNAGDGVFIYYRAEPYREKIRISGQGREDAPIRIVGVPGPNGELPVLDGRDATTHPDDVYRWPPMSSAGVVTLWRGPDSEYGDKVRWVEIENLEIRGARTEPEPAYYSDASGARRPWREGAAGLYLLGAERVTVRGCDIHDNANGIFFKTNAAEDAVSDILFENNFIHHNAERQRLDGEWRFATHNVYGEGRNITYQGNHFGPVYADRPGANLKDRSAGLLVRYNWIEGGVRLLDLVEAQDSFGLAGNDPAYRDTYVYGNVLVSGPGQSITAVHYGGDSGDLRQYRKGTLWFWHNTVLVRRDQSESWRFIVFDLSTNDETVVADNNVLQVAAASSGVAATRLSLMNEYGRLRLGRNWINRDYFDWRDNVTPAGTIDGRQNLLLGATPRFADVSADDLRPAAGSPLLDRALPANAAASRFDLDRQYLRHRGSEPRTQTGAGVDLGAFEHRVASSGDGARRPLFIDGFESEPRRSDPRPLP